MKTSNNLFLVGIASSAGGLTPILDLVSNAICHQNMAYILVPHISREYKSQLPHILRKITSLKIKEIEDSMRIEACHLYVLPANKYVRVVENRFKLDARPERGVNFSANVLFKSLAESYKANSIGVVLSGAVAGSDGSDGVTLIKKAGGHTFAQEPSTAIFPDMPKAAIDTGSVDFILNPADIGRELSKLSWLIEKNKKAS